MALATSGLDIYSPVRATDKQLLFEAEYEPVWILNSDEVQLKENPQYYPAMPEPPKPPPPPPKPGPMVVRVPMCCLECKERVEGQLKGLKGIESYTIDWFPQKVTVIGTEKDPITMTTLLPEMKKIFRKSEIWK